MTSSPIVAIIPAGGQATNTIIRHTNLPDTMLPINGKPVIGYILEDLYGRGITKAIIALRNDDRYTEPYVTQKFGSKLHLQIVRDPQTKRGLGHILHKALDYVTDTDRILIYLGDTIYRGPLEFNEDFVVTSTTYENPSHWCFIEDDGTTQCYVNKPKNYSGDGAAMAGIYFFNNGKLLRETTTAVDQKHEYHELHHTLDAYPKKFKLIPAEGWYDCGNIENYYRAKVDFLKIRSFNSVTYNDLYGSITKSSTNTQKLAHEVNWYKQIPPELQIFSPRLIGQVNDEVRPSYTLEYYGYQSLADYYIFNHFDEKMWRLVIDRLLEIFQLFTKYTAMVPFSAYDDIYRVKTIDRIQALTAEAFWRELLELPTITINGVTFNGWSYYAEKLPHLVSEIHKKSTASVIHGDPCLSNILFDPHSRIFKFIDPRGNFGGESIYGDHHYDIAKLRHSFSGQYDFIVSDLFDLKKDGGNFIYTTFHEPEHENVGEYFDLALGAAGYDLTTIKTIEALLFISMIALHADAPLRQQAMYLTGITLLNSLDV